MDFDLTPDEIEIRDAVRRFARDRLAPAAARLDESGEFCREHFSGLAELGVMGLNLPESYGGAGVSALALALAVEEVSYACAATASTVTAHYLATDAILLGGDEALKQRLLPAAARGEALGAYALTEPGAGSNPAEITTRAERVTQGWHIRGIKHFITNGGEADFVVVFAKTDPAAGHRGIGAFVVERGTQGQAAAPPEPTHGIRASHIFELTFDCVVPDANRIGAPDAGFRLAMAVLDRGRSEIAAMALGIAQAALDAALAWVKERKLGGQPLGHNQGLQWMLADAATRLDAARLLTWRAAALRSRGRQFSIESAMAKLFASEAADFVCDVALQVHGGYGFSRRLALERYVRDARILRIFEGASEIQRNIIGRHLVR
jgi:alkylation response protein AidB-like acyl-CoA dehydrogenase